jgi:hypothetical protein
VLFLLLLAPTEFGRTDGDDADADADADEEAPAAALSGLPYTDAATCNDAATDGPPLIPDAAAAAGDTTAPPLAIPGLRGPLPDDAT